MLAIAPLQVLLSDMLIEIGEKMVNKKIIFSENHLYFSFEDNICYIGFSKKFIENIGDIVKIILKEKKHIEKNENIGILESSKTIFDLIAPASFDILEVNQTVLKNPEKIKKDIIKYWLLKTRITKINEAEFNSEDK